MFNRKLKKARRQAELIRLEGMMIENRRRLEELDRLLNGPCPACKARGWN